mgnify:CR=1 FL=1
MLCNNFEASDVENSSFLFFICSKTSGTIDSEGSAVRELILEVSKHEGEQKSDFLQRILTSGSPKAKVLKCADRISNMISLGYVTDCKFIERYCDETEYYILPIALEVDYNMYQELINLIITRRKYLEDSGYIESKKKTV